MAPNQLIVMALVALLGVQRFADAHDQGAAGLELEQGVSTGESPLHGAQGDDTPAGQLKQSVWPLDLFWPQRARESPDFFLIWMKPYEPFIPAQIQEMIHQQVSPMTEQISAQIIQSVPGSEQMYQQLQQFMNLFQNFGLQNIVGGLGGGGGGGGSSGSGSGGAGSGRGNGNSLSGLIPGLGRRH